MMLLNIIHLVPLIFFNSQLFGGVVMNLEYLKIWSNLQTPCGFVRILEHAFFYCSPPLGFHMRKLGPLTGFNVIALYKCVVHHYTNDYDSNINE